uniref:Serpentine Receptor, class T n=1 Tax=Panagrellus redivivus TaxID=6233 RepID=A0A7E4UQW7_PANRE
MFLTANPVFLTPYMSGFAAGLFRNSMPSEVIAVLTIIGFCILGNTLNGVFLSLMNRYIFMFHKNLRKRLQNKATLVVTVFLHIFFYFIFIFFVRFSITDHDTLARKAIAETHGALTEYLSEKSLVYVSEDGGIPRKLCIGAFYMLLSVAILLMSTVVWFIAKVFILKKNSTVLTKLSRSMSLSALIQAILCLGLLFVPNMCLLLSIGFKIPNSANIVNGMFLLVALHGTLDMICTLYFVRPYRKFWLSGPPRRQPVRVDAGIALGLALFRHDSLSHVSVFLLQWSTMVPPVFITFASFVL